MSVETKVETKQEDTTAAKEIEIVVDPIPFVPELEMHYITSTDVEALINTLFKGVFSDYVGCKIIFNSAGIPDVGLSFSYIKNKEEGKVYAVNYIPDQVKSNDANAILLGIAKINNTRNLHKMYDLTSDAKDALKKFAIPDRMYAQLCGEFVAVSMNAANSNSINWQRRSEEYNLTTGDVLKISGFSLIEFVKIFFGSKIGNSVYHYAIDIERPINNLIFNGIAYMGQMTNNNSYLLKISRASLFSIQKLAEIVGAPINPIDPEIYNPNTIARA